jgi:PIN domain nuclease of toxin-antitoxin system
MKRILLDSHALFWYIDGSSRLSRVALEAIEATDGVVCVSAVTAWEIANKFRHGKWPAAQALANDLAGIMSFHGFEQIPLSLEHARHAGLLESPHRDPFDRMLAAQAEIEGISLVTADPVFHQFNVKTLW